MPGHSPHGRVKSSGVRQSEIISDTGVKGLTLYVKELLSLMLFCPAFSLTYFFYVSLWNFYRFFPPLVSLFQVSFSPELPSILQGTVKHKQMFINKGLKYFGSQLMLLARTVTNEISLNY